MFQPRITDTTFKRESNVTLKHVNTLRQLSLDASSFQPPFVMDKWILGMDQKQTVDCVINFEVREHLRTPRSCLVVRRVLCRVKW